ncbi:MAG: SMC family ATPase [Saprospiraceae bacterium]|nr:SMC family ATPase [Saprospiraceae bacterium]
MIPNSIIMIPKKLTIKGLYSYSEEAIIDFEQLSQAHIFGIFGNVGSGKSAILEAMMLALYGEVPRLGHAKGDNRNFNILNLKSNNLSVDFEFDAGGKKYRSIVEAKRNSKKFEDVSAPKARRFEWNPEDSVWQPHNFDPAEVIGLKLEHFTKTIIVPQNQFQEFLQLKDTDRAKMMSELFNLERFDLSKKAAALESRNKLKLSEVQTLLDQIGDVTQEHIAEVETQLADLERETANDTVDLEDKQQAETEAQQLKKQFEMFQKFKIQVENCEKQTPQYNALEKQLTDYDYCQIHFHNLLEQIAAITTAVADNERLLTQKNTQFLDNERLLEEAKTVHRTLRIIFDNRYNRLREAEELSHILAIQRAEKSIADNLKRLEMGGTHRENKWTEIEVLKQERTTIEAERATLTLPNILELQALKDWFSTNNRLFKEIETLELHIKKLTEGLDTMGVHHQKLLTTALPLYGENYPLSITLSETVLALKKGIQNREWTKETLNKKVQQERAVLELEKLAFTLTDGQPCPLCGALHHPEVMNVTDVHRVVSGLQKEIDTVSLAIKSLQNIENQVETLHTNSTKVQQDRRLLVLNLTDKHAERKRHLTDFTWTNFSTNDETVLSLAFANADATMKRMQTSEKQLQEKNKKIEEETALLARYDKKINDLNSVIAVEQAQKETLEQQLQTLKLVDFTDMPEQVIAERQKTLVEEVKTVEKQFADTEKQLEKWSETAAILRGGISELERNKTTFDKQFSVLSMTLNDRLAGSDFTDLDAIKAILGLKLNVELERKRLTNFRSESAVIQKSYDELQAELSKKTYNLEAHQALTHKIQELKDRIESQNRQIGGLRTTIADLKDKLKRRTLLETERRALDLRAKNIGEIKRLFYASGFVSYVSTVFLKNLCDTANHRFIRLTNHRLRLEITADNTFLVRDLLNDGQTRHIKTLSGGQTFQAALSLALALADNIQSLTKSPQNFFFLDEGFGSLDKESLQIVFDTLKSLRKENRIVGVISHVEEMQQEIERYVKVFLDEEKGSQLSYF